MNLNLVQIVGRITKKPELRNTPGGMSILSFSVATNHKWTDKKTGEKKEETEFHNVTAFGKTAEVIEKYFDKGDEIYISGRLKTDSWEDKATGAKRSKTGIIAEKFDFGAKSRANGGAGGAGGEGSAPDATQLKGDLSDMPDIEAEIDISDLPF